MALTVATWNINSVRLRIDLVLRFLQERRPDVLCLQETKAIDDAFPVKAFAEAGYRHRVIRDQRRQFRRFKARPAQTAVIRRHQKHMRDFRFAWHAHFGECSGGFSCD